MAVTLKDIAELLGVSVNTVSRALKDKSDISEKTRFRVKEAASALGYRPNLNARSLVLKKTHTVGLAVTESDNPVRMEFCEKLRSFAARDGYRILTVSLDYNWSSSNFLAIEDLLARRVDGLILGATWGLTGEQPLGEQLKECRKNGIPVVLFGQAQTELADCVEIDKADSAAQLTRHLLECGYRKITFFENNPDAQVLQGYRQAMEAAGFADKLRIVPAYSVRMEAAFAAMENFLQEEKELPEAVIAANDLGAIGFLAALRKHHISVPQQCAVAGFDNISFGQYTEPPLTTIGYDNGHFSETVWNMMIRRLRKEETGPAKRERILQKLIVRQST
ncbi:MAG: LacI family transcriptional regulator [Lentisphaerae bacterium]|nr:LacI family transcriptional regulator [Lentisphaerota bacterium]